MRMRHWKHYWNYLTFWPSYCQNKKVSLLWLTMYFIPIRYLVKYKFSKITRPASGVNMCVLLKNFVYAKSSYWRINLAPYIASRFFECFILWLILDPCELRTAAAVYSNQPDTVCRMEKCCMSKLATEQSIVPLSLQRERFLRRLEGILSGRWLFLSASCVQGDYLRRLSWLLRDDDWWPSGQWLAVSGCCGRGCVDYILYSSSSSSSSNRWWQLHLFAILMRKTRRLRCPSFKQYIHNTHMFTLLEYTPWVKNMRP